MAVTVTQINYVVMENENTKRSTLTWYNHIQEIKIIQFYNRQLAKQKYSPFQEKELQLCNTYC